jgi:hypothetical protein
MKDFTRDFARGMLLAVPVVAVAAIGVREFLALKETSRDLETQRLEAVGARDAAEKKLAEMQRVAQRALDARLREAAQAAESQGAAEERLRHLIDFLKQEVASSEAASKDVPARNGNVPAHRLAQLLDEISRLNSEIEALREDRDRWKRAAEQRAAE